MEETKLNSTRSSVLNILKGNTMMFVLVLVMILFEVLIRIFDKGSLFAPANITNLIRQNAYVAILATGMLCCILTGGNIDLSVGSIVALVGAIAGVLVVNCKMNTPVLIVLAIVICLITGTLIGAFHGFFIAYLHIPPFITTLAGMLLWRGVATLILNGQPIAPFPPTYRNCFESFIPNASEAMTEKFGELDLFGSYVDTFTLMITGIITLVCILAFIITEIVKRRNKIKKEYAVSSTGFFIAKLVGLSVVLLILGQFLARDRGFPIVLVILAIIVAAYSYFTQNTVPGRYLYAIGGNEKAARLSGVDTKKVMFFAYTNMGFISAIAALVTVARLDSAQPTAGTNYEMDAIASCFIGGASAYGGTGTVAGAVVGAIFMGVLNNGMSILGVDMNWQRVVKGAVLLAAVLFDIISKKKKSSK